MIWWLPTASWITLGLWEVSPVIVFPSKVIAQLVRIHLQCRRPWFNSCVRKILWRRDRLPTPVFLGFPCGSAGKEFACSVGDLGLIPGLGRSPGEGKAYPLQYSGLENSMDYIVHRVAKSQTWLSDFHFSLWKVSWALAFSFLLGNWHASQHLLASTRETHLSLCSATLSLKASSTDQEPGHIWEVIRNAELKPTEPNMHLS